MINANKTLTLALAVLLTGCGLSVPGLDNSNDSAANSSEYKIVLDENYDGYGDDDDLNSAEIDEGAENALRKGKSLLAAGVKSVEGSFKKGDQIIQLED